MKAVGLALPGVILVEPRFFRDDRGHFMESWNASRYEDVGIVGRFVQDNVSYSKHGVLRVQQQHVELLLRQIAQRPDEAGACGCIG